MDDVTALPESAPTGVARAHARQIVDEWLACEFGALWLVTQRVISDKRNVLEALISVALDRHFDAGVAQEAEARRSE